MDQVHVIRHKVLVEGRSQRAVARELGISRLTIKKYVGQAAPARRETEPRARPVWATVQTRVDEVLAASAGWTGGKQQLTATRLCQGPRRTAGATPNHVVRQSVEGRLRGGRLPWPNPA